MASIFEGDVVGTQGPTDHGKISPKVIKIGFWSFFGLVSARQKFKDHPESN